MIEWFAIVQVIVAISAGILCLIVGLSGRVPNDLTMGVTVLVELLLLIQLVIALVAPVFGNHSSGNPLEFYTYLISAVFLPVIGVFWALLDRTRWSTVILSIVCFSIAVMVYRMNQIWFLHA